MGADIHGGAEWKWKDNTTAKQPWGFIAPVPDYRSYDMFAVLADVRNSDGIRSMTKHIPLRGLPEVMSNELRHQLEIASHSYTWYTLDELIKYKYMWRDDMGGEGWYFYLQYLQWYSRAWYNADIRITIGFDN
jgi:hypothetical protein